MSMAHSIGARRRFSITLWEFCHSDGFQAATAPYYPWASRGVIPEAARVPAKRCGVRLSMGIPARLPEWAESASANRSEASRHLYTRRSFALGTTFRQATGSARVDERGYPADVGGHGGHVGTGERSARP